MPIRGQYEQYCNAAALEKMGVPVIHSIEKDLFRNMEKWMNGPVPSPKDYSRSVERSLEYVFSLNAQALPCPVA